MDNQNSSPRSVGYYVAYYDGACEPVNPSGNLGIGAFILNPKRERIFTYSKYYSSSHFNGQTSNNIAEYLGLIEVLKFFIQNNLQKEKIIVCGDNKMSINQMKGEWGCNGGLYKQYYLEALELRKQFSDISFEWIPREKNTIADELSKQEMTKNGCEFRIQKMVK